MDLFSYIAEGKTAFHSTKCSAEMLKNSGFKHLREDDTWDIKSEDKYFVTRNSSSLFAFKIPKDPKGIILAATHSDSPTYKLKFNPIIDRSNGYISLNVSGYGGMIHSSFIDRPLSVAGRIFVEENNGVREQLVDFSELNIVIPNLAIHMNKKINNGYEYKISKDIIPVISQKQRKESNPGSDHSDLLSVLNDPAVLGHDLFLYSKDLPCKIGIDNEFFGAPRIDNLECSYIATNALILSSFGGYISAFAMLDNEEVGSSTKQGADSTFITDILSRIYAALNMNVERQKVFEASSFMLSCDNAHGFHPNYAEVSDSVNRPYINQGIVIKHSANQKYTTDGHSAARLKFLCKKHGIPYQDFENHSDILGGSTLGNISTNHLSIPSVDIGLAQWAMHSAFETAGMYDVDHMSKLLIKAFSSMEL